VAEARPLRLLATLLARFDGAALRVAPPGRASAPLCAPTAEQQARWAPLQRWCMSGADGGRDPQTRLSVAVWTAEPGSPQEALVEAFSRHLDGSHQLLTAGGALAGLLLRLRVKACDVAWWRSRRASDPWDCGYVVDEPAVREALARFSPRRATLMVAHGWSPADLDDVLAQLARSSPQWAHPVRWLLVQGRSESLARQPHLGGLPLTRIQPLDTER
jgi:hypothetical protein